MPIDEPVNRQHKPHTFGSDHTFHDDHTSTYDYTHHGYTNVT